MRNSLRSLALSMLALAPLGATGQDAGLVVTPAEFKWQPAARVAGPERADIVGAPSQAGPYVSMGRFPPNMKIAPHSHPGERIQTVISGTWYIGWGTTFDETKLRALPAGSV